MRHFLLALAFFSITTITSAQSKDEKIPDKNKQILNVEAACGQCKLALPGKSCDLAIRLNGVAYFVDGSDIDSHGDAHAKDGFCNAIRKAEVQGSVVGNRFKATYFKLTTDTSKQEKPKE